MTRPNFLFLPLFLTLARLATAQPTVLLDAMSQELNRNFSVLKEKADPPPYFLSYEISEQESRAVSGTLGTIDSTNAGKNRTLDVSVRVGSPKLDNYHRIRNDRGQFTSGAAITYEDNVNSIKRRLWLDTDRAYRAAAERLIRIKTNTQVRVAAEDDSDDFSIEPPATFVQVPPKLKFNQSMWEERVRNWSARFKNYPAVLTSHVAVACQAETRYLVNSEGSRIAHGRGFARIVINAAARASDGTDLGSFETFEAVDEAGLPDDKIVLAAIDRVANDVSRLLKAPEAEPFLGPAIFSGRAAGVLFHEIFGHRIEGHRQKDESEGQTFTKSVGLKVLPDFLSVVFDPTRRKIGSVDLNGWYDYDDEGVKGQKLTAVDKGVLKEFLMSRSPIKGFPRSNGHGRRQPGLEVVSRQSNLIVESSNAVPEARLRQMLIDEVKKQNKPYGLYFRDITGGFTTTARSGLQAFKVIPVIVYRVYPDGRPDELVRGADIVGTPLASFSKIVATGDKPEVFNGYCGAESGSVPVAAVSPSILVSEIEIEKKAKSNERPPLLPEPTTMEKSK
ncbi:MAG TPA: metallopeptidase TldD-related protein [Candidatus Acidoferrales bacterium]|nr:metallopeptidase TldD-related protein [Candidatus Acidoferrales bacterium]